MGSNGCDAVRPLLSGLLYGDLPAEERERVEAHVAACASCRQALEAMRKAASALDAWVLPPARAAERPVRRRTASRTAARFPVLAWAVAAAVFVVALALHLVSRPRPAAPSDREAVRAPEPPSPPLVARPPSDELEQARREAEAEIARLLEQRRESLRKLERLEQAPGEPAPRPQEAARLEAERAKAVEELSRSETARRQAEEKLVRAETPGTVAVVAQFEWVQGEVTVVGPAGKAPARTSKLIVSGQGLEIAGADGVAVLRFPDQSRLEVGSAAVIRSISESDIDLVRGSIKAETKRPMVVRTPDAEVRVLGTRFRVDAGEATRVDVQEGRVRLSRTKDKASVEVSAGNTVTTGAPRLVPRPLREVSFQDGVSPASAYSGTRDTFLSELNATHPYGTNATLQVDGDNPGGTGKELRMLLRWDLSAVPRGSRVQGAALILQVSMPSEPPYVLHAMKRPWTETEATWQTSSQEKGTAVLGSAIPGPSEFTFPLNAEGIAQVQSWIDAPASNFGCMITAPKNSSGMKAHSRESTEVGKRPRLVVTYTPR